MNINDFKGDMIALVWDLKRAFFDEEDEYVTETYIDLTVGADQNGWNYQTGDNSFTGGAYGYANWAVVTVFPDSVDELVAQDIVNQLLDVSDGEVFLED